MTNIQGQSPDWDLEKSYAGRVFPCLSLDALLPGSRLAQTVLYRRFAYSTGRTIYVCTVTGRLMLCLLLRCLPPGARRQERCAADKKSSFTPSSGQNPSVAWMWRRTCASAELPEGVKFNHNLRYFRVKTAAWLPNLHLGACFGE